MREPASASGPPKAREKGANGHPNMPPKGGRQLVPRSLAPAAYASRVTAATRHPRNWYLIGTAALLQAPGTTGITGRRRLAAAKCPADNGVA